MSERPPTRKRARTWPRARPAAVPIRLDRWTARLAELRDVLASWLVQEVTPGRLFPWLPVAFGAGIVLYFAASREPSTLAAGMAFAASLALAVAVRARPLGLPIALAAAAVAGGFATITLRSAAIDHPVLARETWNVEISGWVMAREERERSDRIVLAVHSIQAPRLEQTLERVRVTVRKGTAPPIGSFVELKARLNPPSPPQRPGGYDFARDLYFQKIGATGFVLGRIKPAEPPEPPSLRLRYGAAIGGVRDGIDARIRAAIPGDAGAIASALITGKRDAISAPVNEAMYVSSLAHVLSISGYHMAVVAGVVFFVVRAVLALIPAFAVRWPIKNIAAVWAWLAATAYLLLSGAEVATQRAYIMTSIVLLGVLADRAALTLRTLAIAAAAVLLITPEAVIHPSFQMSFAATLALVAFYQHAWLPWRPTADTSWSARFALWGWRELAGLVLASLIAGAATTMFAAYHFHRLAPYGVIANLLAMPIVSVWIMPAGLLALAAAPFGFDGLLWPLMGTGIDWMIKVATLIGSLPGAVGRVSAFSLGAMLLASIGLIVLCLLRTPLRWSGGAAIVAGAAIALWPTPADVLIAADGRTVAVRTANGTLSFAGTADAFAVRGWLAADGDPRAPGDPALRHGFACDAYGCVATLVDGSLVAVATHADAFPEDCARARVLITPRNAPASCAAQVIDRAVLSRQGATALRLEGGSWVSAAARPPEYVRPWAKARPQPRAGPAPPQDATPSAGAREADD